VTQLIIDVHAHFVPKSLFERFDAETRHYITILQTTLLEFAETDNCILMGRGGQWLLRGIPHVVRVRAIAPFDVHLVLIGGPDTAQAGLADALYEELSEQELIELAKASPRVQAHLDGKEIRQAFVVPRKLVNLVV